MATAMATATPVPQSRPLAIFKDSSDDGLVQTNDLTSQDIAPISAKSPSYGPRRSLGLAALLPTAIIVLWSFGMGSVLFIWLLAKRIHPVPGSSSRIFEGYLIVDEGNKTGSMETLDGQETLESTMTGVLIITAISHFSTTVMAPLMALGSFYVASKWLEDQARMKEGPTPLQFGLMMQMCSTGTWDSVLMTMKYLFNNWRTNTHSTRIKIPSSVYLTLIIASVVVALRYSIILTDLWLTADVGSAYQSKEEGIYISNSSIASALGTQWNADIGVWDYIGENGMTLTDSALTYLVEGLDVITGQSARNQIKMINTSTSALIQDTSYMAVIVRPPQDIPSQWSWTAPTIGMTARCRPGPCIPTPSPSNVTTYVTKCPESSGILYPSIPLPSTDFLISLTTEINPSSKIIRYTPTGDILSDAVPLNMFQQLPANPSYFLMELLLPRTHWYVMRDTTELGEASTDTDSWIDKAILYLGACEVMLYDVEVSFNGNAGRNAGEGNDNRDLNSQYIIGSPPVPMSQDTTSRILSLMASNSSLSFSVLLDMVTGSLVPILDDVVTPGFSTRVSQELVQLSLAFISGLNVTHVPANRAVISSTKLFSRYPLTRTFAYIGVVYTHGLLAVILFCGIVRKSSRTVVVAEQVQQVDWNGVQSSQRQKPVQEILSVQSRLTDPLAIVAEHFLEPDSEKQKILTTSTSAGALSAQKDGIKMFDVEQPNTVRVTVGLMDRRSNRWYGLKHRKNDVLVTSKGEQSSGFV
ncbi:hypothetical protein FRC02_001033 [Tulasnella sp. 418]|nr:hypothetical protein FRC02_001033 [Tulasnella sp. 418]